MRPGTKLIVAAVGTALLIDGGMNLGAAPTAADPSAAARVERIASAQTAEQPKQEGESRSDQGGKDDGTQLRGPAAERAKAAAHAAVPGASVNEIERTDGTSGSGYEVELIQPDGSIVDVHLDANFKVIKIVR